MILVALLTSALALAALNANAGFQKELPRSSAATAELERVRQIRERILTRQKSATGKMQAYTVTIPNTTVSYAMAPVAAGEFLMGSPDSDPQHKKDEQPQHKVNLDAFWMQAHEVTWDEYRLFMAANQAGEVAAKDDLVDGVSRPTRPYVEMSFGMGINGYPAISMTQHAANKYAEWLSAKTGEFYRVPTEAEWEYACRAGASTPYSFGSDASQLGEYAWYSANSGGKYQKVATKKPNAWGLYDMSGNVMEWTLDQYEPYQAAPATNPWVKPTKPYPLAVRGGSWNDKADMLRCASRVASDPSWKQQDPQLPKSIWYETDAQWLGFRLVRPAKIPDAEEMYRYWNNGIEHDERAAAASLQAYEAVEPHMGTLVRIKLYAKNEAQAKGAIRTAFDRIAQLDDILSDYKPESELNRISRTAVRNPVQISDDLFRVLSASQHLAEKTGGAFDVTLGPLTRLWREARKQHRLPDPMAVRDATRHCGFHKLRLDVAQHTIRFDEPGMQLDVGGIAKGYAADEALTVLSKLGISSALVAASGDLAFGDAPPGQRGWKVGIDSFESAEAPFTRVLVLANGAVSTSGNREQHLDADGRRYSHIVDPKTGMGLTRDITVTVVARRAMDSDGIATAVSVLGAERGLQLIERESELAALIVTHEGGRPEILESSRFRLLTPAT